MDGIPKLRQLRAFLEVSSRDSVSEAAKHLNLSQPAISHSIQMLEKGLGVQLFTRSRRRMLLTEFGTVLLNRSKRGFAQLEKADSELHRQIGIKKRESRVDHLSKFATNHELQAAIYIAEFESVSLAANKLGAPQPAVTRSIRSLEQRLGLPLFERSRRGMLPTHAGETVVRRSKMAFSEFADGVEEIANLNGLASGTINIGVLPLARVQLVPAAVERFLAASPEVKISIIEGTYDSQIRNLSHGDIDIVVGTLRQNVSEKEITAHRLNEEGCALVVRSGHPLLIEENLSLEAIQNNSWVVPGPDVPIRVQFQELLSRKSIRFPEKYIETDSLTVTRSLLTESDRIALVSTSQIQLDERLNILSSLPIDLEMPTRSIGYITRADFSPTPNLRNFLGHLSEVASEISRKL